MNEETGTAFEFYGCFWHGCSKCFSPDMINSRNQKSMGTLRRETFEKSKKIWEEFDLVEILECELKKNKEFLARRKDHEVEFFLP